MTHSAGPCGDWSPIWCEELPVTSAAISGIAVTMATEILWAKSGRQFDSCSLTLRPCRKDCYGGSWPFGGSWLMYGDQWPYPYNYAGQWFNAGCGGCPGDCSCTVLHKVELPMYVSSITQIKIDGAVLAPSAYKIMDYRTLLRVDGSEWPRCNDLNLADTELNTWSIELVVGTTVPTLGRYAVGELAREIALACAGDSNCKLNPAVQQVTRQGITMQFLDPNAMFADGKIGLYWSDLFISTYNPGGIAARAQAIDVSGPRHREQTWP